MVDLVQSGGGAPVGALPETYLARPVVAAWVNQHLSCLMLARRNTTYVAERDAVRVRLRSRAVGRVSEQSLGADGAALRGAAGWDSISR
jgi:hypothetical protein